MFIPYKCISCYAEKHEIPFNLMIHLGELEKGHHSFVCTNGHKVTVIPDAPKHSILIEIAILAYVSGFYRETVASMASALERFQEFYLYTVSNSNDIGDKEFGKAWKKLSNSSERQFGAYCLMFLFKNNIIPPSLTSNTVSFRNEVIHKGHIPNQQDTLDYGGKVFDIIGQVIKTLPLSYTLAFDNWHKYQMKTIEKSIPKNHQRNEIHLESCIERSFKTGVEINKQLFEELCRKSWEHVYKRPNK